MPDQPQEQVQQTTQDNAAALAQKAELDNMMNLHLTGKVPAQENTSGASQEVVTQDGTQNVSRETIAENVVPEFKFETLQQKFGYQKPEEVLSEIEELRKLKANPPAPQPIKYENEESKRLHEAVSKGDRKAVTAILAQQERLEELTSGEVTPQNAEAIIKAAMGLKYKLKEDQINYRFNKQFSPPKEPKQGDIEDDADFQVRRDEWKKDCENIEMEKMIEASVVFDDLKAAKQKLVLPEIETAPTDNGYAQYQKDMEEAVRLQAEATAAYKSFTPKTIETRLNFNDEANKVAFEFQYEPDAKSFEQAVALTSDIGEFFKQFIKQDGTPDREKFLKAIYFATNADRLLTEAMNQSKNATLKAQLPDNSTGGLVRQITGTPAEPSELDKQMQLSGIVRR